MTVHDAIQAPPPDQEEAPRDSAHTFARDPSLRPKARLPFRIKALIAFEAFVMGVATFAYAFGIRPQQKNVENLLPIDALFFCGVSTVGVLLFLIVATRNPPSSP